MYILWMFTFVNQRITENKVDDAHGNSTQLLHINIDTERGNGDAHQDFTHPLCTLEY